MVGILTISEALYPLIMLFLAVVSLVLNLTLAKRSNERFKRDEMKKKADKIYVDSEIKKSEKNTDLKIRVLMEAQEEIKSTLDTMSSQVNWIYQKHYKA